MKMVDGPVDSSQQTIEVSNMIAILGLMQQQSETFGPEAVLEEQS